MRILRERSVALLFVGQLVSRLGDYMLFVAIPFWLYERTGSANATAALFVVLTLPRVVFGPIAGVFVDRWDRRWTMILSDLLRVLAVGLMALAVAAGSVEVVLALALVESTLAQFFQPARTALVPALVARERLVEANAMLNLAEAIGSVAGPGAGGVLMATFGPASAVLADAITFLVSAVAVFAVVAPRTAPSREQRHPLRELVEGAAVVARRPILRAIFVTVGVFMLANGLVNVLIIVLVHDVWGGGSEGLGALISAQGLASILGGVVVAPIATRVRARDLVAAISAVSGLLFLISVHQPSLAVAIALLAVDAFLFIPVLVAVQTLTQLASDDANLGRVSALFGTVIALATLVASGAAGALVDWLGSIATFDLAAAIIFVSAAIGFVTIPKDAGQPAPARPDVAASA